MSRERPHAAARGNVPKLERGIPGATEGHRGAEGGRHAQHVT
eukprot:CAMPEP_0197922332 /NCGR_PEP_ID=MMETSP1439-20131203/92169_1 /TAXON_ID=66791 /ORGANISM="Gonyaulax spinifera, Strain CCMP409" /LENGTH=41 /DNA_ID= /DNA_START= /DNA_END= /DNA_ORIENTATION=